MIEGQVVLPETREVLLKHYPAAFKNPAYLRLLSHVLFSPRVNGQVVLTQDVLAWAEEKAHLVDARNYEGTPFLTAYLRDVHGEDMGVVKGKRGQARTWQAEVRKSVVKVALAELGYTRREREKRGVRLATGRRVSLGGITEVRSLTRAHRERISSLTARAEPADISLLEALNSQPGQTVRRNVLQSIEDAKAVTRGAEGWTEQLRLDNLRRLLAIEHDPIPVYALSDGETMGAFIAITPAHRELHPQARDKLYARFTKVKLPHLLLWAACLWDDQQILQWLLEGIKRNQSVVEHLMHEAGLSKTT